MENIPQKRKASYLFWILSGLVIGGFFSYIYYFAAEWGGAFSDGPGASMFWILLPIATAILFVGFSIIFSSDKNSHVTAKYHSLVSRSWRKAIGVIFIFFGIMMGMLVKGFNSGYLLVIAASILCFIIGILLIFKKK